MAITEILEESEMIDAGAPSIKYEGERPLKKQEMLMAGPDWYIKRMELLMDEYGYDYDEAGEIAYDSDKYYEVIGIDPGGIGDESRNMKQGIPNTKTIKNQPHMLAYITPNEVDKLKALGGQETMTPEGVPAYPEWDNYGMDKKTFEGSSPSSVKDTSRPSGGNPWGDNVWDGGDVQDGPTKKTPPKDDKDPKQDKKDKEQEQIKTALKTQAQKKAKTKKIKDFITADDAFYNDEENEQNLMDIDYGETGKNLTNLKTFDTNKDGKIGPLEKLSQLRTNMAKDILTKSAAQKLGMMPKMNIPNIFASDLMRKTPPGVTTKGLDEILGVQGRDPKTGIGTMEDPFEVDYSMSQYGLTGKDLTRARNQIDVAMQDRITQDDFDKVYGNKPPLDTGGPDNQDPCKGPNPPAYCFTGGKPIDEEEVVEEEWMMPIAFRAEGGRVGKAYGGIMDKYTGRRAYGLGSIFKKAKKIFKSPLGKAALLGLGGYKMGLFGSGGLGGMLSGIKSKGLGKWLSGISTGKVAGAIGGISLATALLSPPVDENNDGYDDKTGFDVDEWRKKGAQGSQDVPIAFRADGGDAESGLMNLGGMEKDYRADGGFVPIGKKERADDVPARLSKNEFVFTADAVRNAGGGDVDKGAEVMYNMMKNLEAGGDVSEESQGLDGARQMFQTSQRLEEVL
jgi:hypothetical protein